MPNVQEAASTIKHIPSKKEWDAASIFKSSIAAPGHSVGLFNAHHLLKLDKIDFIEGAKFRAVIFWVERRTKWKLFPTAITECPLS